MSERSGTALSEFVQEFMGRMQLSVLGLANRSIDPETGQRLRPQWVTHLLEARVPRSPEQWRYRALAVGMDVDPELIRRLAASQWIGVELLEDRPGEWVTVEVPAGLTEEQRRIVRDTALNLARQLAGQKEDQPEGK